MIPPHRPTPEARARRKDGLVADPDLDDMRTTIAQACRVLAVRGLAEGFLGHVSVRVDDEHLLIRCRGPHERGLAFTVPEDVRLLDMQGGGDLDGDRYRPPNELALHTGILRARPDVRSVVHAHPASTVAADLAGLPVQPLLGAYDIPGAQLAAGGVPVYPRSVLISEPGLGEQVAAALDERPVVILRGHGLAAAAAAPERAVLDALAVDVLSRFALTIASAGGTPRPIPDDDLAALPDLGAGLQERTAWRHELARLPENP
jgi:3,4-dihydroxyphthalate decarboxylase